MKGSDEILGGYNPIEWKSGTNEWGRYKQGWGKFKIESTRVDLDIQFGISAPNRFLQIFDMNRLRSGQN